MFAPLIALAFPFLLWPIEVLLPFPFFVEEVAKAVLVVYIINIEHKFTTALKLTIATAVSFSVSETIFYFFNIYIVGEVSTIFKRLALTGLMHTVTFLIIFAFTYKSKKLIPLGLFIAGVIHFLYNTAVPLK